MSTVLPGLVKDWGRQVPCCQVLVDINTSFATNHEVCSLLSELWFTRQQIIDVPQLMVV